VLERREFHGAVIPIREIKLWPFLFIR